MLGMTLLFAAFLGLQQPSPAATATNVSGKVFDRGGGMLPGVTVSLAAPAPAPALKAVTNAAGEYKFSGVAPGIYTLSFELTGFLPYSRQRLTLTGQSMVINAALDVGPLSDHDHLADAPPPPPESTFKLAEGEVAVGVRTSLGTFYIAVDTKRAPITAGNFLRYVDARMYDWGRFHRATRPDNYTAAPPNRPMMNIIQGGINPAKRNEGFPAIPLERTTLTGIKHVVGVVSMARGTPDSATSDFFVLLDDQPSLDYGGLRFEDGQGGAAFGHVLAGLDVVKKIQQQPVDGQNLSGPVAIHRIWRLPVK